MSEPMNLIRMDAEEGEDPHTQALTDHGWVDIPSKLFQAHELVYMGMERGEWRYYVRAS